MVSVLAKSGDTIADELTGENAHLLHMAVGISGEIGEILEAFHEAELYNTNKLDTENVIEELGDLEFYLEGLRQGLGFTREYVVGGIHCVLLCRSDTDINMSRGLWYSVNLSIYSSQLLDLIKKTVVYQKEVDLDSIYLILSKIESIIELIRWNMNLDYSDIIQANIAKLGKRYEGFKYSDSAAQTRADKQ